MCKICVNQGYSKSIPKIKLDASKIFLSSDSINLPKRITKKFENPAKRGSIPGGTIIDVVLAQPIE